MDVHTHVDSIRHENDRRPGYRSSHGLLPTESVAYCGADGRGSIRLNLAAEVSQTMTRLRRSITEPIREGQSWNELWRAPDRGLICCWERGRQKRGKGTDEEFAELSLVNFDPPPHRWNMPRPDLAARAENGELVPLAWKGGVAKKLQADTVKHGTLSYLATWQGLRGEDLDIDLEGEVLIVCSKTGQAVLFGAQLPPDEDVEGLAL
jgi:hypothetical protein